MIRYAIENNRIAKDYLINYTNAAFIVKEGFKLPEDGLYSGFDRGDPDLRQVDLELRGRRRLTARCSSRHLSAAPGQAAAKSAGLTVQDRDAAAPAPLPALPPKVAYDLTLQHPRCVFQLLKQQYSRYTPEMVERITGIPKDQFLKAADLFTSIRKDGDMKKVATILYAVGWTQHSFGTQIIRTAAMLQLLLGNVGRAGGGVNALRGHSNIQGATDMGGMFDILAGLFEGAESRRHRSRSVFEAHHADAIQAGAVGFVQLLVEHAEVCRLVA